MNLYFWVKELLHRKSGGKTSAVFLFPLILLSFLWAGGQALRRFLYAKSLLPSEGSGVPTICVGNITLGGTGKTPIVEEVCRILSRAGEKPAIIARGYGGKLKSGSHVVSDGEKILLTSAEAGDEPVLLAGRLLELGVPVAVAPRRVEAAKLAVGKLGATALVMDDGFGHLSLRRDLNVVVIDATRPFGNGFCMPRGTLREPMGALSDAGAIVLTRTGGLGENYLAGLSETIKKFTPGAPIFRASHNPDFVEDGHNKERHPLEWLKEKRFVAFAGIGNPEAFFASVRGLGGIVAEEASFPDHFPFGRAEIERLLKFARLTKAHALITTEKDMQRLKDFLPLEIPVVSLNIKMEFLGNDADKFAELIEGTVSRFRGR